MGDVSRVIAVDGSVHCRLRARIEDVVEKEDPTVVIHGSTVADHRGVMHAGIPCRYSVGRRIEPVLKILSIPTVCIQIYETSQINVSWYGNAVDQGHLDDHQPFQFVFGKLLDEFPLAVARVSRDSKRKRAGTIRLGDD